MKPTTATSNAAQDVNCVPGFRCSDLEQRKVLGGTPKESIEVRIRNLYRSMSTYDIAQLLHMPEAQVYRAVFGTRAASLREHQRTSNATAPTAKGGL